MSENHLIIAAAGTGGHVMPGLAVAEEMKKRGWTVSWIGTPVGMEGRLVGSRQIDFDALDFTGMRGKGLSHMVGGALKLIKSCFAARSIIKRRHATVLFFYRRIYSRAGSLRRPHLRDSLSYDELRCRQFNERSCSHALRRGGHVRV